MRRALKCRHYWSPGGLVERFGPRARTPVANSQAAQGSAQNGAIVYGLHVALPSNMKNFPPELVPLP